MEKVEQVVQPIQITDAAVAKVRLLIEGRDAGTHALRVFVAGGGCSGLQYGMTLDPQPLADDHRFRFNDVEVIIDPNSITHLSGATIDYVEDIMASGFQIQNPNAIASCGCGHSFRTERGQARNARHDCRS